MSLTPLPQPKSRPISVDGQLHCYHPETATDPSLIDMADHRTQQEPHVRPHRFVLLWLAGIAAILVTMTVAALLNQAGHFVASMVCACLCALSLIPTSACRRG